MSYVKRGITIENMSDKDCLLSDTETADATA